MDYEINFNILESCPNCSRLMFPGWISCETCGFTRKLKLCIGVEITDEKRGQCNNWALSGGSWCSKHTENKCSDCEHLESAHVYDKQSGKTMCLICYFEFANYRREFEKICYKEIK